MLQTEGGVFTFVQALELLCFLYCSLTTVILQKQPLQNAELWQCYLSVLPVNYDEYSPYYMDYTPHSSFDKPNETVTSTFLPFRVDLHFDFCRLPMQLCISPCRKLPNYCMWIASWAQNVRKNRLYYFVHFYTCFVEIPFIYLSNFWNVENIKFYTSLCRCLVAIDCNVEDVIF